ncbi:MAG: serine/threonine-protein kinase [Planctomycetota bacterium]
MPQPRPFAPDPTAPRSCNRDEGALDLALAAYLERHEHEPELEPEAFAASLPETIQPRVLRELAELRELDRLTAAPARELPPRFGDFRLLHLLGEGGGGRVFEAEQISLGRRVALKTPRPGAGTRAPAQNARFRREAQITAALDHPGIAAVHGTGMHDGIPFYYGRLVEGWSLQQLLQAAREPAAAHHGPATAFLRDRPRIAACLARAADALAHAHERSIVHRDIKPANLMLDAHDRVTIIDFGLAEDANAEALTRTGDFLGTPQYMSPEQANAAPAGPASDVYALGVVLYECLTGAPPTPVGPVPHVLAAIRRGNIADPTATDASIPAELAAITLRCLETQPSARFASAGELATALRHFAHGGFSARTERRARRQLQRRAWRRSLHRRGGRAALATAGAVAATLVAACAWAGPLPTKAGAAAELRALVVATTRRLATLEARVSSTLARDSAAQLLNQRDEIGAVGPHGDLSVDVP